VAVTDYHKCIVNAPLSGTAFFYALMSHKLYLDESGDLGWKFHLPNRQGGSSRYLTIAYIIIPLGLEKKCSRFVKSIYDLLNVKYHIENVVSQSMRNCHILSLKSIADVLEMDVKDLI